MLPELPTVETFAPSPLSSTLPARQSLVPLRCFAVNVKAFSQEPNLRWKFACSDGTSVAHAPAGSSAPAKGERAWLVVPRIGLFDQPAAHPFGDRGGAVGDLEALVQALQVGLD